MDNTPGGMAMTDLDQIEKRIEEERLEALKALAVLRKYFQSESSPSSSKHEANGLTTTTAPKQPKRGKKSNRDKAIAVLKDWTTAENMVQLTGLTLKQVYGVLTAPGVKEQIEKREIGGNRKEFRLKTQAGSD
jgi:hypothetical protein